MASFAEEKRLRAHLELIAEGGTYAGYFSQGTNADGDASAYYITNDSDITAAEALLDAKIAELSDVGGENAGGEGPSEFTGYTAIHYDNSISDYCIWSVLLILTSWIGKKLSGVDIGTCRFGNAFCHYYSYSYPCWF